MLELTETEKVIKIVDELNKLYKIREFVNKDPYKVLVRTILSQRTRDENTDQATKNLFGKYKNIYEIVDAPTDDVEELIRCSGFYRVKAARIKEVSRILIDQYGGEVPDNQRSWLSFLVLAVKLPIVFWFMHLNFRLFLLTLMFTEFPTELVW